MQDKMAHPNMILETFCNVMPKTVKNMNYTTSTLLGKCIASSDN